MIISVFTLLVGNDEPGQLMVCTMASEQLSSPPRAYTKREYVGAVTLLHFSRDGSLLFAGVGSTLYVYETATGRRGSSYNVFQRGILHGLDAVHVDDQNYVVFFGQKRLQCAKNLPISIAEAADQQFELQRFGKAKLCSDWVFDVQILHEDQRSSSDFPLVAVGLAHNFIQIWEPVYDTIVRSVISSERCILYSLAFHGRREDELLIASGTVFQQVLLWNVADAVNNAAEPKHRLHGHEGVIFKLEWSNDARELASVSDDRTVQLWHSQGESSSGVGRLSVPWESRYRAWGHAARLWDVCFCQDHLVTVSEDGMCRVWDQAGACVARLQGHSGKHVWRVAVHPSQQLLATGGGDGAVKLWDLHQQIASTGNSAGEQCPSITILQGAPRSAGKKAGKKATTVSIRDIVVKRTATGTRSYVAVDDGRIFALNVEDPTTPASVVFSVGDHVEISPQLSCFALDGDNDVFLIGDASGTVLIVDAQSLAVKWQWTAHNSRIMKIWWQPSLYETLVTCAADGSVKEWQLCEDSAVLVGSYQGPAQCATASVEIIDLAATRVVICGDARGNIFGFTRSCASVDTPPAPSPPSFLLRAVHGHEMVATLAKRGALVYSGGHDGYICTFLLDDTDEDAITLRYVGRESIKGITTVKQLSWNDANELIVLGFHATHAVLFNFTAQYRLLYVECGGWRRPHALLVDATRSIPSHTFVFSPSTKTKDLHVQVHSTAGSVGVGVARASLHHQFHGRMTTCARALASDRLVTAAEDNSLKLHRLLPVSTVEAAAPCEQWTCQSTAVAHTTTIRALEAFYVASCKQHIVLSGGGKQRLNVWRVRDDMDVIEFLCGQEMSDADQDHRILGLATFALGSYTNHRLIVACNSEGSLQLLLLDLGEDGTSPVSLKELGECSSSKKPILSCGALQQNDRALLAVGSTDGMVNVWDLSEVVATVVAQISSRATPKINVAGLEPVHKYLAHDMGVNCLCISSPTSSPSSFRIISGGDDQNLHVHELAIDSLAVVCNLRMHNASGSALKAVATARDGGVVYAAGYDQRTSRWRLTTPQPGALALEWQCAAFTECADIADLEVWDTDDGIDTVVVVGQGLQTLQFTNQE